jgi:hypothetical protein
MCLSKNPKIVTLVHPTCEIINKSLAHVQVLQYKISIETIVVDTSNGKHVNLTLNLEDNKESVIIDYIDGSTSEFLLLSNPAEIIKRLQPLETDITSHNFLPVIINETGIYIMRNGQRANIHTIKSNDDKTVTVYGCQGSVAKNNKFKGFKGWHESGRATFGKSEFDIMKKEN